MDRSFTPRFLRFDALDSTNSEALRQAQAGAAEGLCITAREQSAGRGRQQRVWASNRDAGLYLSLVLFPQFALDRWPLITLMAAVAVHQALQSSFGMAADIKWPNDLLAAGKKLGGILAETFDAPAGRGVVLGIGVNLRGNFAGTELELQATSVANEIETAERSKVEPIEFSVAVADSVSRWYGRLGKPHGAAQILAAWCERSSYVSGREVRIETGGETLIAHTDGLTDNGALIVRTAAGERRTILSADVTAVRPHGQ